MRRFGLVIGSAFIILGAACDDGGGGGSSSASIPDWVEEARDAISGSGELSDTPEVVEFDGEKLYVFEGDLSLVLAEDCGVANDAASAGEIEATSCVERGSNQIQLIG